MIIGLKLSLWNTLLNMQKYPNVTERSHIHFSSICQQTTKQIANLAWIFIFVNEFSVKFVFVFVQTRHFLPSFVTFYTSLFVFDNFKSLFSVFACLCQL